MRTNQEIFKFMIEAGYYEPGKYMCCALLAAEVADMITEEEAEIAKISITATMRDFQIKNGVYDGDDFGASTSFFSSLQAILMKNITGNSARRAKDYHVLSRTGVRDIMNRVLFEIYLNWDHRETLLDDLLEIAAERLMPYHHELKG